MVEAGVIDLTTELDLQTEFRNYKETIVDKKLSTKVTKSDLTDD